MLSADGQSGGGRNVPLFCLYVRRCCGARRAGGKGNVSGLGWLARCVPDASVAGMLQQSALPSAKLLKTKKQNRAGILRRVLALSPGLSQFVERRLNHSVSPALWCHEEATEGGSGERCCKGSCGCSESGQVSQVSCAKGGRSSSCKGRGVQDSACQQFALICACSQAETALVLYEQGGQGKSDSSAAASQGATVVLKCVFCGASSKDGFKTACEL